MPRLPYDSDLNDQEYECIAPYIAQKSGPGRKRTIDIRERPFNKELIDYDRFEYILAVLIDGAPYERRVYTNRPLSDGYE